MRWALLLVVAAVATFFGFLGLVGAGVCEFDCPSDTTVSFFRVLFYGGMASAVAALVALIVSWLRKSRASSRGPARRDPEQ